MKDVVQELNEIVDAFARKLGSLSEDAMSKKQNPEKWSKKEVIGHLIDSAQNNLRRFIICQYETTPPKIVYDQDFWVKANNYQQMPASEVITLWKLINRQIAQVLTEMDPINYQKQCDSGRHSSQLHTVEWLAIDYVKHLKHHINQVFTGSFQIVYP